MKNIYAICFILSALACYSCSSSRVRQNYPSAKDSSGITFNKSGINRSVPPPVNRNSPQGSVGMGSTDMGARGAINEFNQEKVINNVLMPGEIKSSQSLADSWRSNTMSNDKFLLKAYQSGLDEIAIARDVKKKTSNALVLAYANKMIADYTDANKVLRKLAAARSIPIAADYNTFKLFNDENSIEKSYLKLSMDDHQAKIAIYEKITSGSDEEVKEFANKQLPVLKAHLTEVLELYQKK